MIDIYSVCEKLNEEDDPDVVFYALKESKAEKKVEELKKENPDKIYEIAIEEVDPDIYKDDGVKFTARMSSEEIDKMLDRYYRLMLLVWVDDQKEPITLYEARKQGYTFGPDVDPIFILD